MFTCFSAFASTAMHNAKQVNGLAELDEMFIDKIHEIEHRYEERLETLRNELMHDNEMLRKSVDELHTKLEIESREKSDAIQLIEKDFSEKETKLTKEIKDLKGQLMLEHSIGDRKTGDKSSLFIL